MSNLQKPKQNGKDKQGGNQKKVNPTDAPVIKDERFKAVHYDPKFAPLSKKNKKTKVDKRFEKMFKDERFKVATKVDKYGREIEVPKTNKEMEDFYYVEDEDDKDLAFSDNEMAAELDIDPEQLIGKNKENKVVNKNEGKKVDQKKDKKKQNQNAPKANGEKPKIAHFNDEGKFEWNEESSDSDFDIEEIQRELDEQAEIGWESESDDNAPEGEPTNRLALVKYDWENIHASDIMLFMTSFVPKNGFIKSVTVYPSDFGLQRMKEEELEGPKHIWKTDRVPENDKEREILEKTILDADQPWIFRENENEDIDPIKLRQYEKDRLKYYYAIIDCDSVRTAKTLYDECNGMEFELTSIKIDLSYVPDGLQFPHPPKEVCTEIPATSKVHNFLNRAVNHTNVKLTWEEPKPDRFDSLFKNLKEEDFGKIDFNQYISSDTDDEGSEEDDEEEIELRRKALLGSGDVEDWRADFDKSKKRKHNEMEMVIKFNPGFDELGNKILEKANPEKGKENKKNKKDKKNKLKVNKDDEWFVEDAAEEEEAKKDDKKYKDELELLVEEGEEKKGFKLDVEDERFAAIYKKGDFSIDPTSKYYDPKSSGKLLQEQVQRRKKKVKTA